MGFKKQKEGIDSLQKELKIETPGLFTYDERTLRREVIFATFFYFFILVWGLCFKFGNAEMLATNYKNLSELNLRERFLWDIIPFYTRQDHTLQWLEFFANSVVFAPFGVLFNYLFKKRNILRDFAICLALSLSIEVFQLYTLFGGFATADLIMNGLGYFLGLVVYYLIFKNSPLKTRIWTCRVANFILFVLLFYAVGTMLQVGDLIISIFTKQL